MKCPSCGGENSGKFCQFCGSEMPTPVTPVNVTNNYYGSEFENQSQTACCPQCGSTKIGFKRERTGTNSKSSSRKKYIGTGSKGTYNSQANYRTVGLCQNCGYAWTPNSSSKKQVSEKDQKTILYIFGFVFIFPLPITYILLKNQKCQAWNKWLRYGLIALSWILYFCVFWPAIVNAANKSSEQKAQYEPTSIVQTSLETATEATTTESEKEDIDLSVYIDDVVTAYNKQATEPLVYTEEFIPSDKTSGHYRTEFRLDAWRDAIGKSYKMGDITVDIVASPKFSDAIFRIYADHVSIEEAYSLVQIMSPIMDETMSAADLNKALAKIENADEMDVNGFYYGELGITLLHNYDAGGFDLMIDRD